MNKTHQIQTMNPSVIIKIILVISTFQINVYSKNAFDHKMIFNKVWLTQEMFKANGHQKMNDSLKILLNDSTVCNYLDFYLPLYPDSTQASKSLISIEKINQEDLNDAYYWLSDIVQMRRFIKKKSCQVLIGMYKGDDCLCCYDEDQEESVYLIDGRVISFIIFRKNSIAIDRVDKDSIYASFDKYCIAINFNNSDVTNIFYRDANCILGTLSDKHYKTKIDSYDDNMALKFVVKGNFIIFQIKKIKHPVTLMYEPFSAKKILGSTEINNVHSFNRFYTKCSIDWENELDTRFPGIRDSFYVWQRNYFDLSNTDPRNMYGGSEKK